MDNKSSMQRFYTISHVEHQVYCTIINEMLLVCNSCNVLLISAPLSASVQCNIKNIPLNSFNNF